jgi:hypothetical protein
MKLRNAMKNQPGHDAPGDAEQIALREIGRLARLAEGDEQLTAPELHDGERHPEDDRGPQPDAQCAAHHARLTRAVILRGERRHRRDDPHADHEHGEQHGCASAAAATA